MKQKFSDYFMKIAEETANLSYAKRLKVGCVIVKDKRILSFGYNGTPSGWDNNCEDEKGNTKPEVLHAESNALLKLCQSNESSVGSTVFITHAPCIDCAKLLHQAGVAEIIYKEEYRSKDGIDFLTNCGVKICQKKTTGQIVANARMSSKLFLPMMLLVIALFAGLNWTTF
jgi:dCMP deaminase